MEAGASRRHVIQGQFQVSCAEPACSMTTILGSCISVCLFDPRSQTGGMNHFLLASGTVSGTGSASYGVNAMELLINGLLKLGAERGRLRARVFGGAKMVTGLSDVGERNAQFALEFLKSESIRVLGSSTGGMQARRITFWPCSGHFEERFVRQKVVERPVAVADTGGLELF